MFTNIDDALTWIMNKRNNNYSFTHFKDVCRKFGDIQNKLKVIHVAGTDGKGSTVNYLSDLLRSQGFSIGTFTSPHYITHLDRIRLNSSNITDEAFLDILNRNYDFYIENDLSMFEMDYLIMAEYFLEEKVDYAIVEVGLGGRLDSTNVIDDPLLEIITTIGYDHMDRLGNTLEEICHEKCGIIKNDSVVLIGHLNDECVKVVEDTVKERKCKLYKLDGYTDLGNRRFIFHDEEYEIGSYASYQLHNASLALYALQILSDMEGFDIDLKAAKTALKSSLWHCRFEVVHEDPRIILDGAHNIHGIEALCESYDRLEGSKCIIFSALKRKEYLKMIEMLKQHCDELIITSFEYNGVIDLDQFVGYKVIEDYHEAIREAVKKYDNILICGSLYFMSDVVLNCKFDKIDL
ncbi:MAG: bifunctional folylpolyglutamate synthase/dihydrofolate synthase [Erysipelotrichaceae bacterium]|nr:bifunctional folylpolyglutamate synthase/dihydrofolate synthase [Erysipelotrichaceae bacterium]